MLKQILRLIYPRRAVCMGCGDSSGMTDEFLCSACLEALTNSYALLGLPPSDCGVDGAVFVYYYNSPAGSLIRRMKFGGVKVLADRLAEEMANAWAESGTPDIDLVVPVPMHPKREKERGYNAADLLASRIARKLNIPYEKRLKRTVNVPQQSRLTDQERRKSLVDSFKAEGDLSGKCVLLIDDVCTTGTTAKGCAHHLRKAGAKAVYLLCYATARSNR